MKKKKGFTLVELLAVIVILAIILVIAVPQIMNTISSAKSASLESSAKMVAAQVENQHMVSQTLGTNFLSSGNCTNEKWAGLNDKDYESCTYKIENGKAKVTLVGKGKFDGLYVCDGEKTSASATNDICAGMCSNDTVKTKFSSVSNPYQVGNYDACINFFKGEEGENFNQEIYNLICNDEEDEYGETLEDYLSWRIEDGLYTEDELIENNVIKVNEVEVCLPKYPYNIADYVNNLYTKEELRSVMGLDKDNTKDQNIRYAGSNKIVKNYVEFGNTGELWRIIGTFNVKTANGDTEKLVKIVKDVGLIGMSWDSSASDINSGQGINQWGEVKDANGNIIYEGADLMKMLNTYYIGKSDVCTYCNGEGQSSCENSCNDTVLPINNTYVKMIENVVWKTGSMKDFENMGSSSSTGVLNPIELYNAERSLNTPRVCDQGSSYDENCEEIVIRTTEWKGLVALMYPTDWSYASSNPECKSDIWYGAYTSYNVTNGGVCTKNNWVSTDYDGEHTDAFEFLTSMDNFLGEGSALFMGGGGLNLNFRIPTPAMYFDSYSVKPSLYLKSNVKIISGNGSRDNPYKLGM